MENWPSICIRHFVDPFGARVAKFLSISLDARAPLPDVLLRAVIAWPLSVPWFVFRK